MNNIIDTNAQINNENVKKYIIFLKNFNKYHENNDD